MAGSIEGILVTDCNSSVLGNSIGDDADVGTDVTVSAGGGTGSFTISSTLRGMRKSFSVPGEQAPIATAQNAAANTDNARLEPRIRRLLDRQSNEEQIVTRAYRSGKAK